MVAVRNTVETAIFENDLGMPGRLADVVHLDAGVAQDGEGMSKRPAHRPLLSERRLRTAQSAQLLRVGGPACVRARHAHSGSAATRVDARPLCPCRGGGAPASMPPAR